MTNRILFSLFFFFFSQLVFSQKFLHSTEKEDTRKIIQSSIDTADSEEIITIGFFPSYESVFVDFQSVNSSITQKYGPKNAFSNLQYVGIGFMENLDVVRKYKVILISGFQYLLPQFLHINDSVSLMLSGYKIPIEIRYDLLPNKPKIDFLVGAGWDFGELKLLSRGISRFPNYVPAVNKFSALKMGITIKVVLFKGVSAFAGIQYYGDFSNMAWKNKVADVPKYGNFAMTGLSGNGGLVFEFIAN
ncbi:MAG: hypothetical protein K1X82_14080 [Bacteroidia bacterium]|nr:hypothetical protein [Bacteroidia bacterium]